MSSARPSAKKTSRGGLEQRKAIRRAALIEAGVELFGTRGYRNCSVKMVCDQAGLTERYFYESFGNREALLLAVYASLTESFEARLTTAVANAPAATGARLHGFVRAFFDHIREDPRRGRILMFEILGVSPEVDARYRAAVRKMAALVEHPDLGVFAGGPTADSAARRVVSTGLVGALLQIAIQWTLDEFNTPTETVSANAVGIFEAVRLAERD
ncbi:TetR/AcrR family transcriptional regulator [Gilvimarinus sp. F26214L]|uniref:TetR/AcrR family transcriptional regulator n=1 Tax=Gilvimarinus sp. DZF01 TaxID=3461371 RepID=UPI004045AEA7